MSPKTCSLAVDEIKQERQPEETEMIFEPKLKVLINGRYIAGSDSNSFTEPVKIRGRITVSF